MFVNIKMCTSQHLITLLSWWVVSNGPEFVFSMKQWYYDIRGIYFRIYNWTQEQSSLWPDSKISNVKKEIKHLASIEYLMNNQSQYHIFLNVYDYLACDENPHLHCLEPTQHSWVLDPSYIKAQHGHIQNPTLDDRPRIWIHFYLKLRWMVY